MISSILKKSLQQETKQSKIDSGNDISVCATKDAVALVAKRGAATVIFERQIDHSVHVCSEQWRQPAVFCTETGLGQSY